MIINSQPAEHRFTWKTGKSDAKEIERALRFDDQGNFIADEDALCFVTIRQGLHIYTSRINPEIMPKYDFDIHYMPVLGFGFCLAGKLETSWQQSQNHKTQTSVQQNGVNCLAWLEKTRGHSRYLTKDTMHSVVVLIEPELLETYLSQELCNIGGYCKRVLDKRPTLASLPMTPEMYRVASQALHHPYHGITKQLHLQSCGLSLLGFQIDRLTKDQFTRGKTLSRSDEERIRAAADILLQNMAEPPSLSALSRKVGVNDSKLKWGFKEIFGLPPFQFLRYHRMLWAREMLIEQEQTVSQVAFMIGYENISNFIGAYKKLFGVTPGCDKRKRMR